MRKFTSLLLLGFALGSFAQTPGGVSGSELWFKTAPLNSDLQGYYRWQDFSGDSIRLMLLDSRGVKSELTLPNSSVHYFNFNPSLWLADGFRSLSASLKHGDLSQATVIGVFAPELATIGKDMVVYALDGRKGDGDYKGKYTQQLQVIKDNYATFAVPYNGEDNNDYVDGKGFCCNDGSLEAAQARAMARAAKNNFQEGDTYEKMQFYYHPDHLGSSSYITNLDGEVVQHIEYVPFGEVFIEERNNIWNTPYLFNAKEFDEETGLYYYGARYYDPRVSLWISTDILEEKNYGNSSYAYTYNPITFIDPIGTDTINISYVNKKWKIDAPIIADGNDVFNVANGDKKETYEFSQGEHGKRVNLLNLEIGETKDSYTLGVYHISGEADNGTGFYVAPGGEPSTKNGSGRRIPDGTYPIINPTAGSQWIKPGVGGNVSKRGIRFHYGGTNPRSWTEGCFVLSSGYSVNGNTIHYNADESKTASRNFDNALGAIGHFSYRPKSRTYNREGATFNAPIKHTLILKSRKK